MWQSCVQRRRVGELCFWPTGDPTFRNKVERHRRELREKITGARDESTSRHKARRIAPPGGTGSSSSTARPPHRKRPPHRLHHEGGVREGDLAAGNNQPLPGGL